MVTITRRNPRPLGRPASVSKSGFTLVELLVVIGIIGLLISILLPALGAARKQAATAKDLSNLHQIGVGLVMYAQLNGGYLPYGYFKSPNPRNQADNYDWSGKNCGVVEYAADVGHYHAGPVDDDLPERQHGCHRCN